MCVAQKRKDVRQCAFAATLVADDGDEPVIEKGTTREPSFARPCVLRAFESDSAHIFRCVLVDAREKGGFIAEIDATRRLMEELLKPLKRRIGPNPKVSFFCGLKQRIV